MPYLLHARLRIVAAAVLVCSCLVARSEAAGRSYAVVVGVESYDPEFLTSLRFAGQDARDLSTALQALGFEVISMTREAELTSRRPNTATKIIEQIEGRLRGLVADDTVVVALSGHGVQYKLPCKLADGSQETHFFCPEDANLKKPDSLVSLGKVYRLLSECPAERKLLIVDACRNEALSPLGRAADVELSPAGVTPRAVPKGMLALYSCTNGEKSFEHPDLKHGVFCHHVLLYLQGKADPKYYVREMPTIRGLADYASRETREFVFKRLSKEQVPELAGQTSDWQLSTLSFRSVRHETLLQTAMEQQTRKDFAGAEKTLVEAIRLRPEDARSRLSYSWVLRDLGRFDEAMNHCNQLINLHSNLGAAFAHRALLHDDLRAFDKSLLDAQRAVKLDPKSAYHQRTLAFALVRNERFDEAIAASDTALVLDPKNCPAMSTRAEAKIGKKQYSSAIADCQQALTIEPDNVAVLLTLSRAYNSNLDWDKLISCCTRILELKNDSSVAYARRALAYFEKGNHAQAVVDADAAVRFEPNEAPYHEIRGRALLAQNNDAAARDAFQRVVQLDPTDWQSFGRLAFLSNNLNQPAAAIDFATKAIRLNAKYSVAYHQRGRAKSDQSSYKPAIRDFTAAIKYDPRNSLSYVSRALCYLAIHSHEKCIADCTAAIKIGFSDPVAYRLRGGAHSGMKNYSKAILDFNKAIRLKPDYADAYWSRGAAYQAKGDSAKARRDKARARELGYEPSK